VPVPSRDREQGLRRADIISGAVVVLFGLLMIFVIVPLQIASTSEYGLDPKFFPVLLLWILVAMGALLIVSRVTQPADDSDRKLVLDRWNWAFIAGAAIFFLLGFIAINALGFVIAGAIIVALLMIAIEMRHIRWIELIGVSALAPFMIYWLLYNVFSVQLPAGALFFP
jgi:putative tricarboxylic transport membrane protein